MTLPSLRRASHTTGPTRAYGRGRNNSTDVTTAAHPLPGSSRVCRANRRRPTSNTPLHISEAKHHGTHQQGSPSGNHTPRHAEHPHLRGSGDGMSRADAKRALNHSRYAVVTPR